MKVHKMKEARSFRLAGESITSIANKLSVSKGSVSKWVRDIRLSQKQKQKLKNNSSRNFIAASKSNSVKARLSRKQNQYFGRKRADEKNLLHCIGCMLYWAEGTKSKNTVGFTNMDVNMHKVFLEFLRREFQVKNENISIFINCYVEKSEDWDKIKNYWLSELKLPAQCVRKPTLKIINLPVYNMGVCRLTVNNTSIVQHIYGAIQQYAGFSSDYCLD